jgi:hypothetical protein
MWQSAVVGLDAGRWRLSRQAQIEYASGWLSCSYQNNLD